MSRGWMRILRLFICRTSRSETEIRIKIRSDCLYIIGMRIPDKEEFGWRPLNWTDTHLDMLTLKLDVQQNSLYLYLFTDKSIIFAI